MSNIEKTYKRLSQLEHVLKRPAMYIGQVDESENNVWVLDKNNNKIIEKSITYSPGLYKLFDEIIVNAYDQTIRDKTVDLIKINIDKKSNTISVFNNGKGIDVVIHPKEKIYVPELIFGSLLTSTSFDESKIRITGGIHGLGAKLTAIFSTSFKVEVGDPINKKSFSQTYKNNLSQRSKPEIKQYTKPDGYVKITFKPDLKYFKLKELSDDLIALMERRVYDIAALTSKKIKIFLNNKKIESNTFEEYVKLYTDKPQVMELCDHNVDGYKEGRWKIIVTSGSDAGINSKFKQISFVNGIYTSNGGHHVNYIMKQIIKMIREKVEKKYKSSLVKDQFIKDQLWIFVASVIENPHFSSQTKEEMITPASKFGSVCELSSGFLRKVFEKLNLDEIIQNHIKVMQQTSLIKTDVKKKSVIKGIKKLYDANYAGTKKSSLCTLILTEGDSAKTMAISGLSAIPKATNTYGVFPLKGKLLNIREASHKQIVNNEEFKNLKQIIGLQTNKNYTKDNLFELRYGSIILMMDADVDGSHIKGLFMNMIEYYWPSLLKIPGFIKIFITPVVKTTNKKNKNQISFYTLRDYENWKIANVNKINNFQIKYYKGLGTNTAAEAREYFSNLDKHVVNLEWDDKSKDAIELAFSKSKADERKNWLKKYDRDIILNYDKESISYSNFINKELIHFSNYDNIRSIPNIMDGLKPSQRKVIYAAFKKDLKQDIKVAQFVGYVGEQTAYHHGETSLANTIIAMAQNFVGSNNINLLSPKGQFGTRLQGGRDHSSPRYIFTQLEELTRLIFHPDDDALLNFLDDDGMRIEPEYYVPVIPIVLINGVEGIGTGYSTNIPNFNPLDIIANLENRLINNKQKFTRMNPWYKGFKGSTVMIDKFSYITKGIYNRDGNKIIVTELPVGTWTENYKGYLESLIEKYTGLSGVKNNSNESDIDFVIKFKDEDGLSKLEKTSANGINGIENMLNLYSKINLSNMHLYNSSGIISKYSSPQHILDEFFKVRLEFYQKRKDHLLKVLEQEIKILDSKVKFIDLIINKKINLYNKPKEQIIDILSKNKLLKLADEPPYDYLIKMSFYSFTKEKIKQLKELQADKNKQYNVLKKKSIEDIWLNDLDKIKKKLI